MDMEPIDIARLEEAILLFYRCSSQDQNVTHEWLTHIQNVPQAWQFTWQLMQLDKPHEVQFFGAITLHSKLMKHWQEIPEQNREELKHKILESIILFANGPKIVLNRLCISLSAFIVHMLADWPTAIEDVINSFQNQPIPNLTKEVQLWILLEILHAIPEELQVIYTSVKRATLRGVISQRTPIVIETVENFLKLQLDTDWTTESFTNMIRAVKCVDVWVKHIGFSLEHCESIVVLLLKLVNKCYWPSMQKLGDDGCMSADENDLAETCLKTLISIIMQPDCNLYPKSAVLFIKMFVDSLSGITKMEWKLDNNNEDIVVNIYTLFVSAVERHSRLLLSGITSNDPELFELFNKLVGEILQCTNKPGIYPVEESCSSMALSFWYLLQDELFVMNDDETKCYEYLKPIYAHLTRILVRKSEQPDEKSLDKWNSDDLESFRCYRQDISDTFMYCYQVLSNEILEILSSALDEAVKEIQLHPTNWTRLEASIFCFQAVSGHVIYDTKKEIVNLLHVLSEIPYEKLNEKLLGTALETIGAYCHWFKENPDYIPLAIDLQMRGLNSTMSAQATLGLKELSRECQLQLKPFAEPVLNACEATLAAGQLRNSDSVRLMFSVGKLMSLLPTDKIPGFLDRIVSPCFQELQTILQGKTKNAASRLRTIYRLNMISTLFCSLNTDIEEDEEEEENKIDTLQNVQPVLIIMEKTMPIFRQISEFWLDELVVLETACSALRHAIINLKSRFKPMLEDLCYFLVSILRNRCCVPVLEMSKIAITFFYRDESHKAMMQQFLVELIKHTVMLFEATEDNSLSNISDIIETFYNCLMNVVKKIPVALNDEAINHDRLIYFALKAIMLPENGPIRSGIQFLTNYILKSPSYPQKMQALMSSGEHIIRTVFLCIGCVTPRQQVEKFADILVALHKTYPVEYVVWLKSIVQLPNFPTPLIIETDKSKFVSQILRRKVNKRLLQSDLIEFAIKARGLSDSPSVS